MIIELPLPSSSETHILTSVQLHPYLTSISGFWLVKSNWISNSVVMLHNSQGGMSGSYLPTYTSSSHENENAIPQSPTSSSNLSKALRDTIPLNPGSPSLACPVSECSLVFKGETAHGYLWRHLKRPGIHRRVGDEKTAWLNLHKIEHDRLLATRRITPPFHKLVSGVLTNLI